ncbi:MAG: hypothetical protein IKW71_00695 [Elusimicrobiaceae bacterium]|nr:hypothetical protein [Elusimicrobiaceae bacterium]
MKKLLQGKSGVTILEGIIALGLLALVMAGAFGVLLSSSRQVSQPDMREEMILAVEKANTLLKAYVGIVDASASPVATDLRGGLCGGDNTPLAVGNPQITHDIGCMLPPVCDLNNSSFTYKVAGKEINTSLVDTLEAGIDDLNHFKISYTIVCNGYKL